MKTTNYQLPLGHMRLYKSLNRWNMRIGRTTTHGPELWPVIVMALDTFANDTRKRFTWLDLVLLIPAVSALVRSILT